MVSRMTLSSKSTVRNPQCPPMTGDSWHTSNHARMLKFGTKDWNPMSRTIMRSRMNHVLHVSAQEPSMSSMSLMIMGDLWHTSNHARMLKFGTEARNPMSRTNRRSRMTQVINLSDQEPSMSSCHLWWWGSSWNTYNHARELKLFINVKNHGG